MSSSVTLLSRSAWAVQLHGLLNSEHLLFPKLQLVATGDLPGIVEALACTAAACTSRHQIGRKSVV